MADSAAEVLVVFSSGTGLCHCSDVLLHFDCHLLYWLLTIDNFPSCFGQIIIIIAVFTVVKFQFKAAITNCFAGLLQLS